MTTQVPNSMLAVTPAADTAVVHNTGNETIAGTKTFSSQPVLPQAPVLMTAQNSTSGTSIDFTSIPSWVKRITVMFSGVSLSGVAAPLVQIGTGGSPTTTGYTGGTSALASAAITMLTSTAGFPVFSNAASYAVYGAITLINFSGSSWVASGTFHNNATTAYGSTAAGVVTLSGALNMVRITTTNGTDTFDAGSINILYE